MAVIRVLNLFTVMDRGGAETMCMNLYRNMDRSKVQFDFLVYYSKKGSYDDEIEALGGHVYRIPHLKDLPAHISGARRFFREHKEYAAVHDHMGSNGAFICREAKRAGVATIIYHSHGVPGPIFGVPIKLGFKRIIGRVFNKITYRSCNIYFACGNEAAKSVREISPNVHVLKNAINIGRYTFNADIRQSVREELHCGNALTVGNVARLDDNKNQKFLIDLFQQLLPLHPDSLLLLVGDGVSHDELKKHADDLGIADKVKFLGVRNDIDRLLQAMDVFVFPSIKEGLPVACIEAQAAGLPCIISDSFDPATAVTDRCMALSLDDPMEKWVRCILDAGKLERVDTTQAIRDAGYDIRETSRRMQQFYIDCARNA